MDDLDHDILTAIQSFVPVNERPFDAVARGLGLTVDEFLGRTGRLVASGVVRRLGPVFDSRALGYVSTLVAARVPPQRLAAVAERISAIVGVTHNYERRGRYNLWFTLTSPSAEAEARTLETLRRQTGLTEFHSLPALTVYKIRVQFDVRGRTLNRLAAKARGPAEGPAPEPLTPAQKELVRLLQDGLPLQREPFAAIARRLGWTPAQVVEQIRVWLAAGTIRRFGAVVAHRQLGYVANGMVVFAVPADEIDAAGRRLAEYPQVSHCYRRPALPDFPYNLYAMTHGRSEEEVRATVEQVAGDLARLAGRVEPYPHEVLMSAREFKKESMRYFCEDDGGTVASDDSA